MSSPVLYDYGRSSAAYRVRIVLNLKGIAFRSEIVDLPGNAQRDPEYLAKNPQGLIPALAIDGHVFTQSLAIIDYLDAKHKQPPMVSSDPAKRAVTLARALVIAADIHPLNNLRVQRYLTDTLAIDDAAKRAWVHTWMAEGFTALEAQAPEDGLFGGDSPDLADVCLVPQMYNARRFKLDLAPFPRLVALDARLQAIPAFAAAAPAVPADA